MKRQNSDAGNKGQGYGAEKVPGGHGRQGIRQSLKDDRNTALEDVHNSCNSRPKISAARQKSSSATENLSRGSSVLSETFPPWHKQINSRQQNPAPAFNSSS